MLGMTWDILYFVRLYVRSYIFCTVPFHFWATSIFMVMINIVKIELIDAMENWLLNILSVWIFLPTGLFLIYLIIMWWRSRGLNIIWTDILYNILSNEWEMKIVYQQNFLVGKKISNLFLAKVFPSRFLVNIR